MDLVHDALSDWDFLIRGLRLQLQESLGLERLKALLYNECVRVELQQDNGVWTALWEFPAFMVPCGDGVRPDGWKPPEAGHVGPGYGALEASYPPLHSPQRVRASRTRFWFPQPAILVVEVAPRYSFDGTTGEAGEVPPGIGLTMLCWFAKTGMYLIQAFDPNWKPYAPIVKDWEQE